MWYMCVDHVNGWLWFVCLGGLLGFYFLLNGFSLMGSFCWICWVFFFEFEFDRESWLSARSCIELGFVEFWSLKFLLFILVWLWMVKLSWNAPTPFWKGTRKGPVDCYWNGMLWAGLSVTSWITAIQLGFVYFHWTMCKRKIVFALLGCLVFR